MNKAILMGRLTRDPEIKVTQEGKKIANFTLAVERMSNDNSADFINCTAFDKKADFVEKYLTKGSKVLVSGNIRTENFTNKDGVKVYSFHINTETIEFAESKQTAPMGFAPAQQPAPQQQGFAPAQQPAPPQQGFAPAQQPAPQQQFDLSPAPAAPNTAPLGNPFFNYSPAASGFFK